jgi:hypothetical protein
LPLNLDTSAGGAGKIRSGDRLQKVMEYVFAFGVIGRLLAAGYIRALDPTALFVQRASGLFDLRQAEHLAFEFRVGWRQAFEDKICALAHTRILASIDSVMGFYADMGHVIPSHSKNLLCSRLVHALSEDSLFTAEMAELQKLPVGSLAIRRRMLALDASVEVHMSALAHELVMGYMALDGVVSGGVQ